MAELMFIAPSAYPLGGVQTWLDYVVKGLSDAGHQVTVGLVGGRCHDVARYLNVHPFESVVEIKNPTGSREGRIRAIADCVREARPDMVLSVNIADVYPALSRLKRTGQNTRVAMTLHGIQADFLADVRRYVGVLDGVVCTNRLVTLLTEDAGLPNERIKYAPYGVDFAEKAVDAQHSAHRPIRIAFVGRYDQEQKRVRDIPKVFSALKGRGMSFNARFAGDGPLKEELQAELEAEIAEANVDFMGVLSPAELSRDVYNWADLLLVTSSWETGPIVIWEAMAHGLPVVTSAYVGSVSEGSLLDNVNCLMFPVGDCVAAAERIIALQTSAIRSKVVKNGLALVDERYSKQASVTAWASAVSELLSQPRVIDESPVNSTVNGRLDRLFGASVAETLRRFSGREFRHRSPGSEWPHSHSNLKTDEIFLQRVADKELAFARKREVRA